jgi:hypothetical protein
MTAPDSVTLSGGTTGTVDASFDIYVSNDGSNWDAASTTITVTTASGNKCVGIEDIVFTYIKISVTNGGVVSGTVKCTGTFRE